MAIERIAVIGAGQMGNGIAQVAACSGFEVVMIDINQEAVDRGMATIEPSRRSWSSVTWWEGSQPRE